MSYHRMQELAGVITLRERRVELVDKFTAKCIMSERFCGWFPERVAGRASRRGEKYLESFARCERLKNLPLFYMRRRLNGKEGKTYGKRNAVRQAGGASRPERVRP